MISVERRVSSTPLGPALAAATVAFLLLLVSWTVLHVTPLGDDQLRDTRVYQPYGEAMLRGELPYRDFQVEYPPGALPAFVLPAVASRLLGPLWYDAAFETMMFLCAAALAVLVVVCLHRLGSSLRRMLGAAALVGLAPLLVGTVSLSRFDLYPAALTAGAVAALLCGRSRIALIVLAVAVATKIYPFVLVPVALVYVNARRGNRETLIGLAVFGLTLLVIFGPFLAFAGSGVYESISGQMSRPLQLESLGSAGLLAASQFGAYEPFVLGVAGSDVLEGDLPDFIADGQFALQTLAVMVVWLYYLRSRRTHDLRSRDAEMVLAATACIVAFVALGKVFSPQFVIWLLPFVPLLAGRRGVVASGLLAVTLALTQAWFPQHYHLLRIFEGWTVWTLLARDVAMVALLAVVLVPLLRARATASALAPAPAA